MRSSDTAKVHHALGAGCRMLNLLHQSGSLRVSLMNAVGGCNGLAAGQLINDLRQFQS
jgi:hypothetical protein